MQNGSTTVLFFLVTAHNGYETDTPFVRCECRDKLVAPKTASSRPPPTGNRGRFLTGTGAVKANQETRTEVIPFRIVPKYEAGKGFGPVSGFGKNLTGTEP